MHAKRKVLQRVRRIQQFRKRLMMIWSINGTKGKIDIIPV